MTRDLCADPEVPAAAYSSEATLWTQPKRYDSHPFAGGNRAFTLDVPIPSTNYQEKPIRTASGPPCFTWVESLKKFLDGELWKQSILEGLGTCVLVWVTGLAAYSLVPTVS